MPQNNLMGFALDMIQQIARNLCDTYGVKPEDAVAQAKSFFHIQ